MTGIDRPYVLSVLSDARGVEEKRAQFYSLQPYPAMTLIAEDHAYSLALLIDALSAGLLEQLHDQAQQNLLADVVDRERKDAWTKYLAGMTASPVSSTPPLAVEFAPAGAGPVASDEDALIQILHDGVDDGPVYVQVLYSIDGGPDVPEMRQAWDTELVDRLLAWKDTELQAALATDRAVNGLAGMATCPAEDDIDDLAALDGLDGGSL